MKKKILLIENDIDISAIITLVLEEEGYDVLCITNYDNIFELINSYQPDIILLDVVKPTTEGTALCRELNLADESAHIPVIVLSTHPHISKVKEICADEVVQKPFDIDNLLAVVKEQFNV